MSEMDRKRPLSPEHSFLQLFKEANQCFEEYAAKLYKMEIQMKIKKIEKIAGNYCDTPKLSIPSLTTQTQVSKEEIAKMKEQFEQHSELLGILKRKQNCQISKIIDSL